jgi:hypothetical protein
LQEFLQLLFPEFGKYCREMATRILARRNEDQASVLNALEFALHDPSFWWVSLVVRRIDGEHCGLDALDTR